MLCMLMHVIPLRVRAPFKQKIETISSISKEVTLYDNDTELQALNIAILIFTVDKILYG